MAEQQALGVRATRTDVRPYSRRRLFGISSTTEVGTNALMGRFIAGYRMAELREQQDTDGTELAIRDLTRVLRRDQFSAEAQLLSRSASGRVDGVLGAFWLANIPSGLNVTQLDTLVTPIQPPTLIGRYERLDSQAVFGELHWQISSRPERSGGNPEKHQRRDEGRPEGLHLTAGARRTWDRIRDCYISGAVGSDAGPGACAESGETRRIASGATTWTLGLERRWQHAMAYITARRAYRLAGLNVPLLAPSLAAYQRYLPETLQDVEVGLKLNGFVGTRHYVASVSAYRGLDRNIQRSITLPSNFDGDGNPANDPTALTINAARAWISGVETMADVDITRHLRLSTSSTLTYASYSDFRLPPAYLALIGSAPSAQVFSYTPRWTTAIGSWRPGCASSDSP